MMLFARLLVAAAVLCWCCDAKLWIGSARLSPKKPWVPVTSFAFDMGTGQVWKADMTWSALVISSGALFLPECLQALSCVYVVCRDDTHTGTHTFAPVWIHQQPCRSNSTYKTLWCALSLSAVGWWCMERSEAHTPFTPPSNSTPHSQNFPKRQLSSREGKYRESGPVKVL